MRIRAHVMVEEKLPQRLHLRIENSTSFFYSLKVNAKNQGHANDIVEF
jgi:hypothetical protein